jgi:hypothetical protein
LVEREEIVNTKKDSLNSFVFGSQLFDSPTLNFEPTEISHPRIIFWSLMNCKLAFRSTGNYKANRIMEGSVVIQYVGEISLSGISSERATKNKSG